jgi:hypothetical protein
MLIHMEDVSGAFKESDSYADNGKLRGDLQALKGLAEDAARLVPELAPSSQLGRYGSYRLSTSFPAIAEATRPINNGHPRSRGARLE